LNYSSFGPTKLGIQVLINQVALIGSHIRIELIKLFVVYIISIGLQGIAQRLANQEDYRQGIKLHHDPQSLWILVEEALLGQSQSLFIQSIWSPF
jgi:hypothetical protein